MVWFNQCYAFDFFLAWTMSSLNSLLSLWGCQATRLMHPNSLAHETRVLIRKLHVLRVLVDRDVYTRSFQVLSVCHHGESAEKPSLLIMQSLCVWLYREQLKPLCFYMLFLCSDHGDQLAMTFPQNPYISSFTRTSILICASTPIGKRKRSWLLKHKNTQCGM